MHFLFLNAYFDPESIAFSHLENDLISFVCSLENSITVICPTPTRGVTQEVIHKYKKIKLEKRNDEKLTVKRFWAPQERKKTLIRAVRYLWCNFREFQLAKKEKNIDLVFSNSTPPTQGLLCGLVAKQLSNRYKRKVPFVYSLQDIFPDSLVYTGLAHKGSLIWKIGRWVENITYKNADKIIVISEGFKKNIMAKGVPEEKIVVIPNWVDENKVINVPREENTLFDKYDLDRNKFYVCYSGNIGFTQNMEALCYAAKKLESEENIGIVIVGDGAFKPQLEKMISEQKIKNITLIPFQDYSDISKVFSLGDVGLIISKAGIGVNSVPSKTWSIMSAERPVLACFDLDSELCEIVKTNNCGVCVSPDDVDALVCAIKDMKNAREENIRMGKNGRQYILEKLGKDMCTGKYVDVFKKCAEEIK